MLDIDSNWDPYSHDHWSKVLGLACTPLFGKGDIRSSGCYDVMLDGPKGSFSLISDEIIPIDLLDSASSWAWSANLNHNIFLDKSRDEIFLQRWDTPYTTRRFRMPKKANELEDLFEILVFDSVSHMNDVIIYLLKLFRILRAGIPNYDALAAIEIFNHLLFAAEIIHSVPERADELKHINNVEDLYHFTNHQTEIRNSTLIGNSSLDVNIKHYLSLMINSEQQGFPAFNANLLLRHAIGQLYQEAHLVIINDDIQLYFPNMPDLKDQKGYLKRDIRFTPSNLARSIAEEALNNFIKNNTDPISILDPACGSGIFLLETLRYLQNISYRGSIKLFGYDISAISCLMARFTLERAKLDAQQHNIDISYCIHECNALSNEWVESDVILMNPPFISMEYLDNEQKFLIKEILKDLKIGRVDIAMAFIWKAIKHLNRDGILFSILPTSLFETKSGEKWRDSLLEESDVIFLGRFLGHGIFKNSMVRPGVLGLRRNLGDRRQDEKVKLFVAKEGHENSAIRGLRKHRALNYPLKSDSYDIYYNNINRFDSMSWLPRSIKQNELFDLLNQLNLPKAGDLFVIHQGVKTGLDSVFVLKYSEFKMLEQSEKKYFRKIAGSPTIFDGIVEKNLYLFYPYDRNGPILNSEKELKNELPYYYSNWLKPNKKLLQKRASFKENKWWLLTRPRNWMFSKSKKLISKSFGLRKNFIYDSKGSYAVVQGYAWFWKKQDAYGFSFQSTELLQAYYAILNSPIFENILQIFCPRLVGGYYDLSKRYISRVFLPNLADINKYDNDIIIELQNYGKDIHENKVIDNNKFETITQKAYGL